MIPLAILFLQSDAFWTNLPMIITAIFAGVGTIFSIRASNRSKIAVDKTVENKAAIVENKTAIEEVHKTTNSKIDKLLESKDALAKSIADAKIIEDREKAAFNAGKLAAIEQKDKDDALRNMPPPYKEIPSTELTVEKVAEKAVEKVVEKVVTEKDDALKKKP